jgi:hypothetical protein
MLSLTFEETDLCAILHVIGGVLDEYDFDAFDPEDRATFGFPTRTGFELEDHFDSLGTEGREALYSDDGYLFDSEEYGITTVAVAIGFDEYDTLTFSINVNKRKEELFISEFERGIAVTYPEIDYELLDFVENGS